MSWIYLRDQGVESLEATFLDGKPSVQLKEIPTVKPSCWPAKLTASWNSSRSGMMLEPSKEPSGVVWSTSLPLDSPVNHSPAPVSKKVKTMNEISGRIPFALFKKSNPNLSFSKMSQDCSEINPIHVYAAGLIDGEGHIGIQETHGKYFCLEVTVGMSNKAIQLLNEMKKEFGGTVLDTRKATDRWEAASKWRIGGEPAIQFLKKISPFVMLKSEQIQVAMELSKIFLSMKKLKNGSKSWSPSNYQKAKMLKEHMHDLNRKGPQDVHDVGGWYREPDLFGIWARFLETWPRLGSMRNGACFPLTELERHIAEKGSGLWPTPTGVGAEMPNANSNKVHGPRSLIQVAREMWPTPRASDPCEDPRKFSNRMGDRHELTHGSLSSQVMFPTPRASDADHGGPNQRDSAGYPGLSAVVQSLWPTPGSTQRGPHTGRESEGLQTKSHTTGTSFGMTLETAVVKWPTSTADDANNVTRKSGTFSSLTRQVQETLPTQASRDYRSPNKKSFKDRGGGTKGEQLPNHVGGLLNPDWVEILMGWPLFWTRLESLGRLVIGSVVFPGWRRESPTVSIDSKRSETDRSR